MNTKKLSIPSYKSAHNWLTQVLFEDWGQKVLDHWRAVVFVVLLFTSAVVAYSGYGLYKEEKIQNDQVKVFKFLKDWKTAETKVDSKEAAPVFVVPEDWARLKSFYDSLNYPQTGLPVLAELLKRSENLAKDQEAAALSFFQYLVQKCSKEDLCFYYSQLKLAAISEDMGNFVQAETSLKTLVSSPWKNEEQVYFDLSRIAYLSGKESELKSYGEYFLKLYADSPQAGIVKFFLKNSKK
jgi:hypothetical protein